MTRTMSVADALPSSVVGICLGNTVNIATITSKTTAEWKDTGLQCLEVRARVALAPCVTSLPVIGVPCVEVSAVCPRVSHPPVRRML